MTMPLNPRPKKNSRQRESRIKQQYPDLWNNMETQRLKQEQDPKWQQDNLEWDLRTCTRMLEKVRASNAYAQNLYAAMCNQSFIKNELLPVLKNQRWSCSWRYAGGIIADMREQGDYMDWYCSGIRGESLPEEELQTLTLEQQEYYVQSTLFVSEGVVTDEIRADLFALGWCVVPDGCDE